MQDLSDVVRLGEKVVGGEVPRLNGKQRTRFTFRKAKDSGSVISHQDQEQAVRFHTIKSRPVGLLGPEHRRPGGTTGQGSVRHGLGGSAS